MGPSKYRNLIVPIGIVCTVVFAFAVAAWAFLTGAELPINISTDQDYNAQVGIADLGVTFSYPKSYHVEMVNNDPSFIKILPEGQNDSSGMTYDEMTAAMEGERLNDFPIYIRAKSTTEIPFFARLRHLESLSMSSPEKREEADNFIPGYKTLETVGKRGPGTFFITQNGQTIFEFYRPANTQLQAIFNKLAKTFKFTSRPIETIKKKAATYDLALSDVNYNIWLMNTTSKESIKVAQRSGTDSVLLWQPEKESILYRPIYRIQSYTFGLFNVVSGESANLNEQIGIDQLTSPQITGQGQMYFRDYRPPSIELDEYDESGNKKFIHQYPLYLVNDQVTSYKEIGNSQLLTGVAIMSPDAGYIVLMKGEEYPPQYNELYLYNPSNDESTKIADGKSVIWLSDSEFYFLIANNPDDVFGYSLAKYNTVSNNTEAVVAGPVEAYDVSTDESIITYLTHAERGEYELFQLNLDSKDITEVSTSCDGQIYWLESGSQSTFAFQCNGQENQSGYYLWDGVTESALPYSPRSVSFAGHRIVDQN